MTIKASIESVDYREAGTRMHGLMSQLYPICRSITGDGVRESLRCLRDLIPLELREVPTGTRVFDWTVPREWNIRDAWIKDSRGQKVIDFHRSNLHVVNYSTPVRRKMTLSELRPHLHTLPDRPSWIPYRTSYYNDDWGFCLAHEQLERWDEGEYEVCIDSRLIEGSLTYGEWYLPGRRTDEVLLSCHICHPSLCNDNLSGVVLTAQLAYYLQRYNREYSYRFLFIPGTIGSITWLARNEDAASRIRHGLVVACVGDSGTFHYKRSRRGDAQIDRAAVHVLRHRPEGFEVRDFSPYGYDERQYCSPGFNLPVGCLSRTPHGQFPQYHTSADDLTFVTADSLAGSLEVYLSVIEVLEHNTTYINRYDKCEPCLGLRGLYRALGGMPNAGQLEMAMLWVLNLSDGKTTLLDIAERSGLTFVAVKSAANTLAQQHLLEQITAGSVL